MKSALLISFLMLIRLVIVSSSCNKATYMCFQEKRKKVLLGEYTPYRLTRNGDSTIVGFVQSARLFTLKMALPHGKKYFELLGHAMKKDTPVRVLLFENSSEIAGVDKASPEAVRRYIQSKRKPN